MMDYASFYFQILSTLGPKNIFMREAYYIPIVSYVLVMSSFPPITLSLLHIYPLLT
jgi:hypothetical protein